MLICDNEALLIRIETASEWEYMSPNVTLRVEWDIKELKMTFVSLHVKSHQDNDTPTANLTLQNRLKLEAGCLATKYMQEDLIR
jgi:hypothetical protein